MPADLEIVTKGFPQGVIALLRVGAEFRLRRVQLREEGEPLQSSGGDLRMIDPMHPPDQLPEISPIEKGARRCGVQLMLGRLAACCEQCPASVAGLPGRGTCLGLRSSIRF
ncbi:MAG: hypothetical protein OXB95_09580, partial [Rhodobacteraceae bacterium]|nr:hypothetical protein [Paracoccaceae bacterium]